MSDCAAGLSVTAIRQKEPSFANGLCPPPRPARPLGGLNAPGATCCASVTTPCGIERVARLSHVAASDEDGRHATNIPATHVATAVRMRLIWRSLAPTYL